MHLPEIEHQDLAAWVQAVGAILAILVTAIIAGSAEMGRRIRQGRHRRDHARVTRELMKDIKRGLGTLDDALKAADDDRVGAARTYLAGAIQASHLLLAVRIEFGPSSQYLVIQSALAASLESLLADLKPGAPGRVERSHVISGKIIQANAFADKAASHVS